jgi:hypothetical protein
MFWNPPTANNNDQLPLYDGGKMEINWDFLNDVKVSPPLNPPLTPRELNQWLISPLKASQVPEYVLEVPGQGPFPMIPAEWNLFGDNACGTVQYEDIKSTIIGGELTYNDYISQDALVNQPYQLHGNPFGSNAPTPARFVDVSPWQNTFTALYFDKLVMGDASCGLTANRQYRMLDKFLNFNWGALGGLSYVTTTWQTCFPAANLEWALGDSALLKTLKEQMEAQKAKGLMFRFSNYLTFYDKNGIFNDYPPVDSNNLASLEAMYQKGLNNVADIFFNPAYNSTAGTLGLWFEDEFPTTPGGRRLIPTANSVPLYKPATGGSGNTIELQPDAINGISLGVALAECHNDVLSLDLSNTFPFYPVSKAGDISEPEKFYAGTFNLGVNSNNTFSKISELSYEQYNQAAFDKRSGLTDIQLNTAQKELLQTGALELRLQGPAADKETVAQQMLWTAEVIESASFIDVGDSRTLNIMVQYDGKPAPADTVLWVAEYNNPFMLTTSDYYLAFTNPADFPLFNVFPDSDKASEPILPQFNNHTSIVNSTVSQGSGRSMTAVLEANHTGVSDTVMYQSYLKTPAGLSLAPCLQFTNPIQKTGKLDCTPSVDVNYSLTQIKTNSQGMAQITVKAINPGFPTLRFFVQQDNQVPDIPFSFPLTDAYTDYLSPLRILPEEPELMKEFVDYWNRVYQNQNASKQIWLGFIYPKILKPFYYLYPIMDKYMPLDSLNRIEGAVDQLIVLISKPYQEESTLAMPITRDLPQSRRAVLERWAKELVKLNYPPTPLVYTPDP